MMKALQSVALSLMMMMMGSVSAGPLPPSLIDSRHDDQISVSPHLLNTTEENSTRFESRPNVNNWLDDFPGNTTSNTTTKRTHFTPFMDSLQDMTYPRSCVLATCQTANLGSALQGGDQTAGSATSDPFGIGKK